jgi:hypothetical protein
MRCLSSNALEASVIQQNLHWWLAKENMAQFQAQLKDCSDDIRRPMIDRLLDQQSENLADIQKVTPRF